jgi:pimeloyl-ACP methyl ester carboxylesterase
MLARILADGEASPPMRPLRAFACALGLALACAHPLDEPPRDGALAWRDCGGGFQCATLRVPIDHAAAPAGPALTLAVLRLPAEQPARRLGILVVNPGGPGMSAIAFLRSSGGRYSQELRERFDLLAFDTRGTGGSAPLDCHAAFETLLAQDPDPTSDSAWQGALDASRAFAAECAEKYAERLPFMSTADNARDLEWLRAALQEEKLSYLGYSYGTALGAVYATLFPERVRALVLDGSIDPRFELLGFSDEQSQAVEAALRGYDAEAAEKGWHGVAVLDALYARAPRKSTLLFASAEGLSSPPQGWRELAHALGRAQQDDWSGLDSLSDRYFGTRADGTRALSVEAQLATLCSDLHRLPSAEAYRGALPAARAASPHFGPGNLLSHLPCAFWPATRSGPLPEPHGAAALPPVLVLANHDDPLTPHLWGERLAADFPSATRIDIDSREHTAYNRGNACVDALVERYLVEPAPPAQTHCP